MRQPSSIIYPTTPAAGSFAQARKKIQGDPDSALRWTFVPAVASGGGHENPKSECRNPTQTRHPKKQPLGARASRPHPGSLAVGEMPALQGASFAAFVLRICVGFRISRVGFATKQKVEFPATALSLKLSANISGSSSLEDY